MEPSTNPLAVINSNIFVQGIDKHRLVIPPNICNFVCLNQNHTGKLRLRLISASNLVSSDINGYSDPYIKVKATSIGSIKVTKIIEKNLNPIWEEEITIEIKQVEKELLVLDIYDHDLIGNDDLLGFIGVDLSLLPLGYEVVTNESLSFAKHGSIQIGITALDFGVTNLPENYIDMYITWRNSLPCFQRKEFKALKKSRSQGIYYNKTVHPDYKFVCGWLKRKKSKREKAATGLGKSIKKVAHKFAEEGFTNDGGGNVGFKKSHGDYIYEY